MSDLISRSDLYNKLVELETLARNRVLDTPTNSPCYQRYVAQMNERTMFKELVADMQTAYNVEKVVAELEKASVGAFDIQTISFRRAVDIVRKGGADERT
jgi:hypothetical protein